MITAFSTDQVYAAETDLMARLPEGELMARAVEGLTAVAAARLADLRAGEEPARVAGLIGTGNNGADALYALAHLGQAGHPCAAVTSEKIHAGALAAAREAGVVLESGSGATDLIADADLVIDGILGIGGRPEVPEHARDWVGAIAEGAYVLAVDLPTGADPNGRSGDPDGIFADETVTFSLDGVGYEIKFALDGSVRRFERLH